MLEGLTLPEIFLLIVLSLMFVYGLFLVGWGSRQERYYDE